MIPCLHTSFVRTRPAVIGFYFPGKVALCDQQYGCEFLGNFFESQLVFAPPNQKPVLFSNAEAAFQVSLVRHSSTHNLAGLQILASSGSIRGLQRLRGLSAEALVGTGRDSARLHLRRVWLQLEGDVGCAPCQVPARSFTK